MNLLKDIQESAMNSQVRIEDLLRKCLVLATKIKNPELKQWADNELNGYQERKILPNYRILATQARGHFAGPLGSGYRAIAIPESTLPEKFT